MLSTSPILSFSLGLQVRALDSFYKTLTNEPLKAFYGEKHVFRAAEAQAIEVLLISDKLFRARVRLLLFVTRP